MFLRSKVTVQETIDFLNELLGLDYDAVYALINCRVPCNDNIAENRLVQVYEDPDKKSTAVGILGILNGLFGAREDGKGVICAELNDSGRILWFKETPPPPPIKS